MSGDDDDPDLLNELSEIAGNDGEEEVSTPNEPTAPFEMPAQPAPAEPILPTTTMDTVETLKSRIELYTMAEKVAKETGDTSKARSRGRGLKTLQSLLKQALAGKTINLDDIPPVVSIKAPNAPASSVEPAAPAVDSQESPVITTPPKPEPEPEPLTVAQPASESSPATSAVDESKINALLARQREYKVAALTAKKSGDTAAALQYVKIIKIFDSVLASAQKGEVIDLSDMPPPPSELTSDMLKAVGQPQSPPDPAKQENTVQQSTDDKAEQVEPAVKPKTVDVPPPEVPKTILEALTQRLQKYQAAETNAKAEGNDRKARQNGRIVKQYLDAIKAHKAGRAVAFEDLPTPPGYPPIPTNQQAAQIPVKKPQPKPTPAPSQQPAADNQGAENTSPKKSPIKRQDSRVSGNHSNTSVMNKNIELLLERQKEFKEAALEAKKAGEIEQAKEFLKTFKGIENLLNVAKGGLPVDLSTVILVVHLSCCVN